MATSSVLGGQAHSQSSRTAAAKRTVSRQGLLARAWRCCQEEEGLFRASAVNEEEEEEESLFKADVVNEDNSERDRATQV